MSNARDIILRFVRERGLIEPGDRVLAAVSGGPDSMALVHLLTSLSGELGFELEAAHLDHGIRPGSADEAERVRGWLAELGVPCAHESLALGRGGPGLENRARQARRRVLEAIAERRGCTRIATGHHAEDAAESLLLHLVRGSGLSGLRGILPAAGALIRPLLPLDRAAILAYLDEQGIPHLADPSNWSLEHTRNRIRHHLLPLLREEFNPEIVSALNRLGEQAAIVHDDLERRARAIVEGAVREEPGDRYVLDLRGWENYHKALKTHALRRFLDLHAGDSGTLGAVHYRDVLGLADDPHGTGKTLHLPGGMQVRKRYGELLVEPTPHRPRPPGEVSRGESSPNRRHPTAAAPACAPEPTEIALPGVTPLPGCERSVRASVLDPGTIASPRATVERAFFDRDRVLSPVRARHARPGDRMVPHGMRGRKKLSDIFIDRKVPREERAGLWVFEDRRGIFWVPGVATNDRIRISSATRRVLALELITT